MSEILIILNYKNKLPQHVSVSIFIDGEMQYNVLGFNYSLNAEQPYNEIEFTFFNEQTGDGYIKKYSVDDGDKIRIINFINWRYFLEELRNENSFLLRK
jgi:hypothetical protein